MSTTVFTEKDIVEFTDIRNQTKRGYIIKHNGNLMIRCPYPHYEDHPVYENTVIIEKGGWK